MSINWKNPSSSSPGALVLQPTANAWLWDKQVSSHQQVSDRTATISQRVDRRIIPERLYVDGFPMLHLLLSLPEFRRITTLYHHWKPPLAAATKVSKGCAFVTGMFDALQWGSRVKANVTLLPTWQLGPGVTWHLRAFSERWLYRTARIFPLHSYPQVVSSVADESKVRGHKQRSILDGPVMEKEDKGEKQTLHKPGVDNKVW